MDKRTFISILHPKFHKESGNFRTQIKMDCVYTLPYLNLGIVVHFYSCGCSFFFFFNSWFYNFLCKGILFRFHSRQNKTKNKNPSNQRLSTVVFVLNDIHGTIICLRFSERSRVNWRVKGQHDFLTLWFNWKLKH